MSTTEKSLPKLLDQKQVSEILRKSPAWLERLRWSGEDGPPFIRIGRNIRYPENELIEWINSKPMSTTANKAQEGVSGDE